MAADTFPSSCSTAISRSSPFVSLHARFRSLNCSDPPPPPPFFPSEDCRRVKGVWLCFGGGASVRFSFFFSLPGPEPNNPSHRQYSGYGQAGFARRMRVYQLSDYGERIETFKFLDTLQVIDRVVLAGEGALGS